jgi:cation transport ATPase
VHAVLRPQLLAKNTEPIESTSPAEASQRSSDSGADEQQEAEEDAEQDENRAPKRKRKQASEPMRKIKKKPAAAPPGMSVCAMQLLPIRRCPIPRLPHSDFLRQMHSLICQFSMGLQVKRQVTRSWKR